MKPDVKLESIARHDLFRDCTDDELRIVGATAEVIAVSRGTTLTRSTDWVRPLVLMLEGDSIRRLVGGTHLRGAGLVGAAEHLAGGPWQDDVEAATDGRCLVIDPRHFDAIIRACPGVTRGLARSLAVQLLAA